VGDFTRSLKHLETGTLARIEGPYGDLLSGFDSPELSPQLWIAGGIGIAPFLSVLRSAERNKARADLHLFLKSPEHDIFREELASLAQPGLRVITHYDSAEGLPSLDAIERISGAIASRPRIVLCGPTAMTSLLRREMKNRGIPHRRIRTEEFHFR